MMKYYTPPQPQPFSSNLDELEINAQNKWGPPQSILVALPLLLTAQELFVFLSSPGGECGNGPPTGKFMGPSELGQFWGAEFENRWYTDNGRGLQPLFHDLSLVLVKNDRCMI